MLERLVLDGNRISVLENLDNCQNLIELSCNAQLISEPFVIEERSIVGISQTLQKLSLNSNKI